MTTEKMIDADAREGFDSGDLRLDSWKHIAWHLGRDVRTVQRWEKREGLPVHRHLHKKAGSVHAFVQEVDAWQRSRSYCRQLDIQQSIAQAIVRVAPHQLNPEDHAVVRKLLEIILSQFFLQTSSSTAPPALTLPVQAVSPEPAAAMATT